jgi:hypothetical protein
MRQEARDIFRIAFESARHAVSHQRGTHSSGSLGATSGRGRRARHRREVCHFVDYMQALCASPPTSVFASRVGRHSSGITDDQCSITLTFADGSIGTIIYTAEGSSELPKERFEAHADGKSLVMNDFMETRTYKDGKSTAVQDRKTGQGIYRRKWRGLSQAVEQGLPPVIPFEQIDAVTRACLLAVRSLPPALRTRSSPHYSRCASEKLRSCDEPVPGSNGKLIVAPLRYNSLLYRMGLSSQGCAKRLRDPAVVFFRSLLVVGTSTAAPWNLPTNVVDLSLLVP